MNRLHCDTFVSSTKSPVFLAHPACILTVTCRWRLTSLMNCVELLCDSASDTHYTQQNTQQTTFRTVSQPVLLSLVTSLVLSRLDYGSIAHTGISRRPLDRLQSMLSVAASGCNDDHVSPLLRVPERIKFRLAVLVFLCRNKPTADKRFSLYDDTINIINAHRTSISTYTVSQKTAIFLFF